MSKGKGLEDLLKRVKEFQLKADSLTPTQKFLELYRGLHERVDLDQLPEAEYEQIFEALTERAGFTDPLDALEALSQLPLHRNRAA